MAMAKLTRKSARGQFFGLSAEDREHYIRTMRNRHSTKPMTRKEQNNYRRYGFSEQEIARMAG